jgi:hypothetical protein
VDGLYAKLQELEERKQLFVQEGVKYKNQISECKSEIAALNGRIIEFETRERDIRKRSRRRFRILFFVAFVLLVIITLVSIFAVKFAKE